MYSDERTTQPLPVPTYTPYLYQSGRFQTYGMFPWSPASRTPVPSGSALYDFSSSRPERTWDRLFTVEQIVAHGYLAVPYAAPDLGLLSDKLHTSHMGLDDLISQIRSRRALYQLNMEELQLAQCEASNAVFRQEAAQGCPATPRQRYSAEKRTQELYQEQREERIDLWKDLSKLRVAMPEVAQQYLSSYRKVSLLEGDSDESGRTS